MYKLTEKLYGAIARVIRFLLHRVVLVSLSLAAQIIVLAVTIYYFRSHYAWLYGLFALISLCVLLWILNTHTNPAYQIAWLIPILVFPVFGALLYLLLGGNRIGKREKKRMLQFGMKSSLPEDPEVREEISAYDPGAAVQSGYLTHLGGGPLYRDNGSVYFSSGEAYYADLVKRLKNAKQTIWLEFFIIAEGELWNSILEILKEKAKNGLDIRVIYDDFGSITRLPVNYARKLRAAGIRCHVFNPYIPVLNGRMNNRDHKKILVIDGCYGYTGGMNLADEYVNQISRFGHWKDNGILIQGPAVLSLAGMFLDLWNYLDRSSDSVKVSEFFPQQASKGFVQPYMDSPLDNEPVGQTVYRNLIGRAVRSIYIMTPYLIIDNEIENGLIAAAKSGVDVRIVLPGIPDKRSVHLVSQSTYPVLINAGVRIFEYSPGFVHSKVFCVDGRYATVGTVNLDFRSLYLHFENGVWLCDADCIRQIEQDFADTFPLCHEITSDELAGTSKFKQLRQALLRTFGPML